jgi:hypothetical protein
MGGEGSGTGGEGSGIAGSQVGPWPIFSVPQAEGWGLGHGLSSPAAAQPTRLLRRRRPQSKPSAAQPNSSARG